MKRLDSIYKGAPILTMDTLIKFLRKQRSSPSEESELKIEHNLSYTNFNRKKKKTLITTMQSLELRKSAAAEE